MYARKCKRRAGFQPVPVGEGCDPVSEGRKHVSEGCKPVSEGCRALLAETPRHMTSYSNLLVVGASREGGQPVSGHSVKIVSLQVRTL